MNKKNSLQIPNDNNSQTKLLDEADKALYMAKNQEETGL